jgi:uncharacterized protein (TIGR02001 family)
VSLGYGVDITSNYISKGSTQTEDGPAIQPYAEAAYGPFYTGVWGSNVTFGGASDIECDIYFGVTPSWGDIDFDISFARYFYRDDNAIYGEAIIKTTWAASEHILIGVKYYREVYADQDWLYLNTELSELPLGLTLSGGVGSDLVSRNLSSRKNVGDIGLSCDLTSYMSADLRFFGGNYDDELIFSRCLSTTRCLVLGFDGAISSSEWKDALWARYCTEAPRRRGSSG